MSMPQVYLFEPVANCNYDNPSSKKIITMSSYEKARSLCNREYNKPGFTGDKDFTTVSVDGSTVGWITKKMVQ